MKILAFADTHANKAAIKRIVKKAKKADILINAGDISLFGDGLERMMVELDKIGKKVLMIHGNHETVSEIKEGCRMFKNLKDIHRKVFKMGDYVFLGFGGGGFSLRDKRFERISSKWADKYKGRKVVLVTHAPPYCTKIDVVLDEHVGNKSITKFIKKAKPLLAISGHLHENSGKKDKIKDCVVVNPGPDGKIIEI
ncbi:hypothetical protein GF336_00775 [Candidatus Woesearchaeota archaeon]|nr:hypothetical protein [Candidatus Woesearchaeota archaeon]